jgi:hypothetical protein
MDDYEEYPELEYLVSIEGFLVPIAHIKAIGWVEEAVSQADYESDENRYFFRVYLDQPISMKDDPATRDLAAFYPSEIEAHHARGELAQKVNDYYKLGQAMVFPNSIQ